jgi:hypothetical protein
MKRSCELSARCLAVLVAAVAACSTSQVQSPLTGDDAGQGGGSDGGAPAAGDAASDASPVDAGGDALPDDGGTPSDGGVVPDGPPAEPGDLAAMCGSVPSTTEDWERCRVKRYCETLVHCSEQNLYTDARECIDLLDAVSDGAIAFDTSAKVRAVAAGRASINVPAFTQCLIDFSPDRCNTAASAPSCPTRYTGTVADGQGCFNEAECSSPGATCEAPDCGAACCLGTCTPRAKLGEPCHDLVGACEPGLVCSIGSQRCVVGDAGSRCDDRLDCDAGSWCDNGICRPDLPEGASCDSLLQCGGETSCVGKFRGGAPARCRHLTSPGDTCDWFCLGNLICDLPSTGFGVCRPLPQLDEACSPLLPCMGSNHRCSAEGKCVERTGLNMRCADGECVPGLFCTDQLGAANPVCRALFADGDVGCKQDAQCESHICSGNQTAAGQCLPSRSTCP